MAYDMIPELLGYDLTLPMWREKVNGIHHASAFISISDSTHQDLTKLYPYTVNKPAVTAHCGISPDFYPSSADEITAFQTKAGITKPYFLLCGPRVGYKNAKLFFQAFAQLPNRHQFEIVCTGTGGTLEPEFQAYVEGVKVHLLYLNDDGLRAAFSGAIALVFPSQYEGFGLPVLEAMTCGCPVITTPSSSLPEVGGNAALYVRSDDVAGMLEALKQVCEPTIRQPMIQRGLDRAKQFSWTKMAAIMEDFLKQQIAHHPEKNSATASQTQELTTEPAAILRSSLEASQIGQIPDRIAVCLEQLKHDPSDRQALTTLNETRRALTDYLLHHPIERITSEWPGDLHRAYRSVWHCGLKNEPPRPIDLPFIQQLATQAIAAANDPKTFPSLLGAILYLYPHQLQLDPACVAVPNAFVSTYMEFMFESPRLFKTISEVDRYQEYFANWTQFIDSRIQANPSGNVERYLCQTYANAANLTPTYFSRHEPVTVQTQRARIIEQFLQTQTTQLDYEFPARPANRQKIRFGILSLNFNPSAETFTVLPIFEQLDRDKFEIHLFAFQSNNSETERYCRDKADRFTHLIHSHADRLVRMIRAADLDILLIGSNITARSYPITLVSAHRLARIQVSGISSSVTTAMRNMDYYIGATLTTPPDTAQRYYTEKLVTLEGSGLCFSFPPVTDEATIAFNRAQLGLNDSTTVFMSGANFRKINPELRDTWAQLLARVPDSILVIYPFGPNWGLHPNLEMPFFNQMQFALQRHGVDLKRLLLIKTMPSVADVRSCLSQADVYLDSFPYSGAASAIDPLTVGVPFVSLEGQEQRERQSSSLLHELGLPELITSSEAEYLDLATRLATDRPLRDRLRQRLIQQMSNNPPFLDKLGYARKIEQLLTQLMSAWRPVASSTTVSLPSSAHQTANTPIEEPVQML
ncbi:MAG: glycosyltransferase [Coleofasciculaceae cyanobacterium RL_1_1]|nr:glycosyltransferase [Coleofasciculaceae cyanobacterium RL_1_1]